MNNFFFVAHFIVILIPTLTFYFMYDQVYTEKYGIKLKTKQKDMRFRVNCITVRFVHKLSYMWKLLFL